MDLDQLKEVWGNVGRREQGPSAEELQALLHKKSKSPIEKMKRNLLTELLLMVVIYTLTAAYYFLNYSGGMLSAAWLLVLIGSFYVFYFLRKRKLLNSMECASCEIKLNLKMQLLTLEKYVRFYMISSTFLVPVVFILTGLIVLFYSPQAASAKTTVFVAGVIALLVAAALVLTIPVYYLNKWYVRKLYGRYIEQLQKIVDEMDEE